MGKTSGRAIAWSGERGDFRPYHGVFPVRRGWGDRPRRRQARARRRRRGAPL